MASDAPRVQVLPELKPCPLCGCRVQTIVVDPYRRSYIRCEGMLCMMRVHYEGECGDASAMNVLDSLVANWNRRAWTETPFDEMPCDEEEEKEASE